MNSSVISANEMPVAIVTGSARGIGLEIARVLGENGYRIMLSDINEAGLEVAKNDLSTAGMTVVTCIADVSKGEDAEKLSNAAVEAFGRIDVLVNNAGITRDGLIMRMDEAAWDLVLKINLKGAFLMSKAVVRTMLKQKQGAIINISSVIGLMGNAGQANYAASKAGLIGFTKSFAKEFGRKGIRANAIAPGFINSEMTAVLAEKVKEQ
ncbi:MAG: hypothetical protein ACD_39C01485G0003, partial [uncultured bacterium]